MNKIEFWYEFASGYSHISANRIQNAAQAKNINIVWKPFLLGPIFKSQGWDTSPFSIYESKGKYMWKDLQRQCIKYDVRYKRPTVFPRLSLLATRVAMLAMEQGWCAEYSKRVFAANYAHDMEISDEIIISAIVDDMGRNSEEIIKLSQSPEYKLKLRNQVNEAISKGIFGAPSFVVNGELFWGNDRMEDAIEYCVEG